MHCLCVQKDKKGIGPKIVFEETCLLLTATHLSSQCYDICFRRESKFCAICFQPTILNSNGVIDQV
jgi:hypothetical protein